MEITKREKDQKIESTRGNVYEEPLCDIYETNNDYKIIFDLPGIEKENINIKVEKDVLTLTAECKNIPEEDYRCLREEIGFTGYKRAFNLNNIINADKISADYTNGSLKLTLPKREEQKTKEIAIKIS